MVCDSLMQNWSKFLLGFQYRRWYLSYIEVVEIRNSSSPWNSSLSSVHHWWLVPNTMAVYHVGRFVAANSRCKLLAVSRFDTSAGEEILLWYNSCFPSSRWIFMHIHYFFNHWSSILKELLRAYRLKKGVLKIHTFSVRWDMSKSYL